MPLVARAGNAFQVCAHLVNMFDDLGGISRIHGIEREDSCEIDSSGSSCALIYVLMNAEWVLGLNCSALDKKNYSKSVKTFFGRSS